MKPLHADPIPFHLRHDLAAVPPIECAYKLGDRAIYTNDAGLKFPHEVRAFSKEIRDHDWGRFIYIFPDSDAWWFPVGPESLEPAE